MSGSLYIFHFECTYVRKSMYFQGYGISDTTHTCRSMCTSLTKGFESESKFLIRQMDNLSPGPTAQRERTHQGGDLSDTKTVEQFKCLGMPVFLQLKLSVKAMVMKC